MTKWRFYWTGAMTSQLSFCRVAYYQAKQRGLLRHGFVCYHIPTAHAWLARSQPSSCSYNPPHLTQILWPLPSAVVTNVSSVATLQEAKPAFSRWGILTYRRVNYIVCVWVYSINTPLRSGTASRHWSFRMKGCSETEWVVCSTTNKFEHASLEPL